VSKARSFTPSKSQAYVAAMLEAGLDIGCVEIAADGFLRVYVKGQEPVPTQDQNDETAFQAWLNCHNSG